MVDSGTKKALTEAIGIVEFMSECLEGKWDKEADEALKEDPKLTVGKLYERLKKQGKIKERDGEERDGEAGTD